MDNINILNTEQNNPLSWNIDTSSITEILTIINNEDHHIAETVTPCIPKIAKLVSHILEGMKHKGRLIYVGSGTSGRLGILDASECPPTFGVSYELVQGVIAGGSSAMIKAKEGAEDQLDLGERDLRDLHLHKHDVIVGIAASGRTPYVIGALRYAKKTGAFTSSISCVEHALISREADLAIEAITGPEVICGSTRMKAGTAQKMILNMISTSTMVKLGKTYHNYMVDVIPTNEKLIARSIQMIQTCLPCDKIKAMQLFEESNHHVKTAILIAQSGKDGKTCRDALLKHDDRILDALSYLQSNT